MLLRLIEAATMPPDRWTSSYASAQDGDRRQWNGNGSSQSDGDRWRRDSDRERDRAGRYDSTARTQQSSHQSQQQSYNTFAPQPLSSVGHSQSASQPSASAAANTVGAPSSSPATSLLGKRVGSIPLSQLAEAAKRTATAADTQPLKPVFQTRKQREELALQRAEDERREQEVERAKREQSTQKLIQAQQPHNDTNNTGHGDRGGQRDSIRDRGRDSERADHRGWRDRESDRKRDRGRDNDRGRDGRHSAPSRTPADELKERELALIKAQHLGQRLDAPKAVRPEKDNRSTKYRFQFGWDSSDDTSADPYALYEKRQESALLYGRGFVGGVDRSQQRRRQEEMVERREKLQDSKVEEKKDERDDIDKHSTKLETADGQLKQESNSADDKRTTVSWRDKRADKETLVMQRQRHWSEKPLDEMEERDWRIFKEDFEINTRGHRIPHPMRSWKESILPPVILHALAKAGYEKPSPIQRAAIPVGLINRDVIGIAETGSGKTVAFLLPMLVYISRLPPITSATAEAGPYALIMAPTRELAQQISDECNKFGREMAIRNVCIVGGLAIEEQGAKLRDGAEVVIGTPGRLIDCVEKRYLVLDQCNYVVLDEADRMIDMNFEPQIVRVMDAMPSTNLRPDTDALDDEKQTGTATCAALDTADMEDSVGGMEVERPHRYRQTIMFSATMAPKVMLLAKKYLRGPVEIAVGDRRGKASSNVEQRVEWVKTDADKKRRLQELLSNEQPPFIIFCNLKRTCDGVQAIVTGCGLRSDVLHGSKTQEVRQRTLQQFKDGQLQVLIATDVMARGIDIDDIRHVVNYEMPADIQSYTHRIGRTGRAGKKGVATSYVADKDADILYDLKTMLKEANQTVPHEIAMHPAARTKPVPGETSGGHGKAAKTQYAE